MPLEVITTLILFTWIAGIMVLERLFPYRRGLPFFREGYWIDLVWYTLIQSYFLKILIFDFIILPIDQRYHLSAWQLMKDVPIWAQVLFFVVTHDFYIYWFHRLQHANKWLWRTHEAHHSGKEVDWLAGSRSHVLEIVINQTVEFAPIILLGADPMVVPIKALLDAMFGTYIHANINVRSGWLIYFLNGPELHLWHHADHQEVYHANFATKFSVWDWLFRSAYLPGHKPTRYGLYYAFPKDYFLQHVFSFRRFDESHLLRYGWFRRYHALRPRLLRQLSGWFGQAAAPDTMPGAAPAGAPAARAIATGVAQEAGV